MTLTPERIAEIDKAGSLFVDNGEREDNFALEELCRLARLGLRVEGAEPATIARSEVCYRPHAWTTVVVTAVEMPRNVRVALVVLEDSK